MSRLRKNSLKDKKLYEIADRRSCTGCGACVSVCPKECIRMEENEEGFLYPLIDHEKCINCGLCFKACPTEPEDDEQIQNVLAGYSRDPEIQKTSSSGGIFSHLAEVILEKDGVVFGVMMEDNRAVTCEISNSKELHYFRGSKYVQSYMGTAYKHAQNYLEEGRWVLFSGTPCQIAGLYSSLRKNYSRLITVDFICHGISSPAVLRKYLRETGNGKKADGIFFRDKSTGWKNFSMKVIWTDGSESCTSMSEDLYLQSFLKNLNLRSSCFSCKFRKIHRMSDITLGDLWGAEEFVENWFEDTGYSMVILQSTKGQELWNEIKDRIISLPIQLSQVAKCNSSLLKSPWDLYSRDLFFRYLPKYELQFCINKAQKNGIKKRVGRKLWKIRESNNE